MNLRETVRQEMTGTYDRLCKRFRGTAESEFFSAFYDVLVSSASP